jgi:hypothetical protein
MTEKFEITIGEDLDGFLGYDQSAIDQIEIEESKENYEVAVRKQIKSIYPDLTVEFAWGGSSHYSAPIDLEPETYGDLQADLEMIEERVYNMQDFWAIKK